MKSTFVLASLAVLACLVSAKYDGYQVWRVIPTSETHYQWLRYLQTDMGDELDFWTSIVRIPGHPVDIMVGPDYQDRLGKLLSQQKLDFAVMIDDVSNLVSNQMSDIRKRRKREAVPSGSALASFDYNVYHPYDEIQQWVTDIVAENPDILSHFLLGQSYEGRAINGFRIRGTGSTATNPPAIWFEGGIHAREWISPATLMGFTQKLIDEYRASDPLVTQMFDSIDWYIVPSLNVDGYSYTWTEDRMWRKTRSPNEGSSCTGTDPNRNWPFEWGGVGTSPWACSDIYHGSDPTSENAVASVVKFCREKKLNGQDFKVFIDWHSYSQVIIAPWSYLDTQPRTKDYDDQMAMAQAMSDAILDVYGTVFGYGAGAEILYPASGSSKDWGYADFSQYGGDLSGGLQAKYSYTVELRDTGEFGFLLPESQIQPTYEETFAAVLAIGNITLSELGISY